MTPVTVRLPDDLAREAKAAGLLRDEAIARVLREALRQRQLDELFTTLGKLGSLQPQLTEAEIDAARAERARRR
jgi:hypothetical protein